jgi:hypothetical protein
MFHTDLKSMLGSRKTSAELTPYRVLLVCIQTDSPQEITVDFLHDLFIKFGSILKVLIFQRAAIIKAFVEFDVSKSAEDAKASINQTRDSYHRIRCYPSNLPTIQITNENAACAKDYSVPSQLSRNDLK